MTRPEATLTVRDVREWAADPQGYYFVHRHDGEHISGKDCWCSPMGLSSEQIKAHSDTSLQQLLDEFFSIN
jgi:hypothetical protein